MGQVVEDVLDVGQEFLLEFVQLHVVFLHPHLEQDPLDYLLVQLGIVLQQFVDVAEHYLVRLFGLLLVQEDMFQK